MKKIKIDVDAVEKCMQPYGPKIDQINPLLEEELKEQTALQLLRLPALYVDGVHARGRIDTANVLGMICAGYGIHDPPGICTCSNQSPSGLINCVKVGGAMNAAKISGKNGSISFGSLLLIMLFIVCSVSGAGYIYWKRSQRHMREQVRSILAEYMPLEDQSLMGEEDGLESPRMHPAVLAAAKSPRGYLPTRGFLDEEDEEDAGI